MKPLLGKSEHHVINSKKFVTKIQQTKLEEETLVSFDVVSLFTNVPVDEAGNIAKERLVLENTLHLGTTLSPDNLFDLLELCLSTTCSQWGRNSMNKHMVLQWVARCHMLFDGKI